jgi:hypothetical protein
MSEIELFRQAKAAHQKASEDLVAATKAAFPVGMEVYATLGRSRVIGRVVSSGGWWWSNPGAVTIENIVTRKMRRFQAGTDSVNIQPRNG